MNLTRVRKNCWIIKIKTEVEVSILYIYCQGLNITDFLSCISRTELIISNVIIISHQAAPHHMAINSQKGLLNHINVLVESCRRQKDIRTDCPIDLYPRYTIYFDHHRSMESTLESLVSLSAAIISC